MTILAYFKQFNLHVYRRLLLVLCVCGFKSASKRLYCIFITINPISRTSVKLRSAYEFPLRRYYLVIAKDWTWNESLLRQFSFLSQVTLRFHFSNIEKHYFLLQKFRLLDTEVINFHLCTKYKKNCFLW